MPTFPSFDRQFRSGDVALFESLTHDLAGQPCVAWRRGYLDSGHLHFGRLVPVLHPLPRQVDRTRGLWIVGLWGCDRRMTLPDGSVLDSLLGDNALVFEPLDSLVGDILTGCHLQSEDLSLLLEFGSGTSLELRPDPQLGADDEQWAIEMPDHSAIAGYGSRRWVLEPGLPEHE